MRKKLYDLMDWAAIEAIVYSEHNHPEKILGAHKVRSGMLVQAFLPNVKEVFIKGKKDGKLYQMEEADEAGFFAGLMMGKKSQAYQYIVKYVSGEEEIIEDPYLYPITIPKEEIEKFKNGVNKDIYKYLGAHPLSITGHGLDVQIVKEDVLKGEGVLSGTFFAVWAPNAMRVSVVGDFNEWDGRKHPMCCQDDSGIFSLFIPNVSCDDVYKYEIKVNSRTILLKTDPYGYQVECPPANASIVADLKYQWNDADWLSKRKRYDYKKQPMLIYEVHPGLWMKKEASANSAEQEDTPYWNYREIAEKLAKHVKTMGYTHIELMPIMEYQEENSLGYRTSEYFAATSRYGSLHDFMYFMDYMHQNEIGVILDWVPSCFSKDENGLARFDGTCLYEHLDPRQGENIQSDAYVYNYARSEVKSFLISNALYWKDVFHADGLRINSMDSMLYLDFGRKDGEWVPNRYGGNENLDAIAMLKELSEAFHQNEDGALLIAEESVSWPMITGALKEDGFGFDLKWNTGWRKDFLDYMRIDPLFRKGSHDRLVLSMIYAYSEKYLLPLSYDRLMSDVNSLRMEMPGEMEQKYGNMRIALGYMIAHPGKKLQFMGLECAPEDRCFDSDVVEEEQRSYFYQYTKDLYHMYRNHSALYENDYEKDGFEWISCLDADHSIIAFLRSDSQKKEQLLVVCNFTPVIYENFKVGVPFSGKFREIFNSDQERYGGNGCLNRSTISSKTVSWDGRNNSIAINVPGFGMTIFECQVVKETPEKKIEGVF